MGHPSTYNTDVAQVTFRLDTAATNIKVWTDSWLASLNFDPVAAVWARIGCAYTLLAEVDDVQRAIGPEGAMARPLEPAMEQL